MGTQENQVSVKPTMDWQQVALNGGPPCHHAEDGSYCGRAERWAGHGVVHSFVARDYGHELSEINNALAESVLEMSDEDIEQEIRDEGRDPDEVAAQVRRICRDSVPS